MDAMQIPASRPVGLPAGRLRTVLVLAVAFALISTALLGVLGRDFFPTVDVGLMKLHVRAPARTFTAVRANRLLGRTGPFWERDWSPPSSPPSTCLL